MSAPQHKILFRDPGHCIGQLDNVVIWISRGEIGPDEIDFGRRSFAHVSSLNPDGFAMLLHGHVGGTLPDEYALRELSRMFADYRDELRVLSAEFGGAGLWARAARTILRTMMLLARNPFPTGVFAQRQEAVAWLVEQVDPAPPQQALGDALDRILRVHATTQSGERMVSKDI